MIEDPLILLLTGVIGLAAGILIGALVASLFLGGKNEKEPEKNDAPPQRGLGTPPGHTEILRVWKDASGKLIPEMDNQLIAEAGQMTSQQRTALAKTLVALTKWAGGSKPAAANQEQPVPGESLDGATSSQEPAQQPETPPPTLPPLKLETSFAASLPQEPTLRDGLSVNPFKLRRQLMNKPATPAPKTFVEMINDILQAQIAGTPLAEQGIQIVENPDGTMTIFAGAARYNHIEEVAEPEVKAAIQAAVATFNRQQRTSGPR